MEFVHIMCYNYERKNALTTYTPILKTIIKLVINRGGLAKCNPIAYWTLEDTFDYIAKYEVPHHPLHAKGYPSIG